ncbi:DNA cytosine methyltransferase [Cytobacillus oceanisediminis]|uniref:DNA cytosine methyltransferase n=1 Tax=Cytobacillus oceanisediminis TaxID=665099 RepID=UPI001CCAE349|nr:DNA cytosine methyltransferase [Cytobacillus oceanisediminis]MBZ9537039.1 DNA cytosine methyltransferase [Cytobacillus oceanisediminis]
MKILNLYCGIGGNRKLWGDEHQVTAVELDPNIAAVYQDLFPKDKVIIGDAHEYLKEHFNEFDFIWASPPCQTHSSFRQNIGVRFRGVEAVYPDMKLYQEIIFLQYNFKGKWVVENVNPYYNPLIESNVELDRHKFWCNFKIEKAEFVRLKLREAQIPQLQEAYGYDLSGYKLPNKRQVLRNCVLPDVGKHILDSATVIA